MKGATLPAAAVGTRRKSSLGLFEVGSHDVDQLFGGAAGFGIGLQRGIDQMHPDVIFDHFAHQAVDRAPRGRDELQDVGTAELLFERALDRLDLSADAPHAVQELGFLSDGMGHRGNSI